jgi:hypothetical protein
MLISPLKIEQVLTTNGKNYLLGKKIGKKNKKTNIQGPYTIGKEKNGNHLSQFFREVILIIKNLRNDIKTLRNGL